MKTWAQLILTGFITSNIYKYEYGDYTFSITNMQLLNTMFSVLSYCFIFMFFYFIETTILPDIIILANKKYSKRIIQIAGKIIEERIVNKFGYNPLSKIPDIENDNQYNIRMSIKPEMYADFMYYPVTIIMILIAFNNLYCYLSILIVLILTFYFGKALNSVIYISEQTILENKTQQNDNTGNI